jgi:hypothetical protein
MLDEELREQLAEWVRPVAGLPVPSIRVLRRRARRRGIRRAATAAAITAVIAAAAVGITASLPGTGRPAGGRPVGADGGAPAPSSSSPSSWPAPPSWPAAPGTWTHGVWQPAGPQPAADASPAAAPYIVLEGIGRGIVQVRNVFTDKTIATVQPLPGQYLGGVAAAGDDRTFVVQAAVGGQSQQPGMPPVNPTTVAFDELRLRPDGQLQSLRLLFTIQARNGMSGFAISQDASMLAYATNNSGFETVSLATGTGRSWAPVDSGTVGPDSLSWAGDRTLAFEWSSGDNPHPPGTGIRVLNVTALGTLLQASRLIVSYGRYCAAFGGCQDDPVITPDGSKVMVTKAVVQGGSAGSQDGIYTDSVVEYSTRTGQALANVAPPLSTAFPGPLCVPLWTDPAGEQVVSWCQRGERYDQGRVSPVTLHLHMNGTDILGFAW